MRTSFDAVIIGGGPAGAATALGLTRAGWSVALVERSAFPRKKVCGEFLSATNLPLLDALGLADAFLELAGPEVRRVGVFAGQHAVVADMPRLDGSTHGWGRAIGRELLDTVLLDRAAASGAVVWQPCTVSDVHRRGETFSCVLSSGSSGGGRATLALRSRVLIAAHGSWDAGQLATHPARRPPRASDLFGFKARFIGARLPPGLMPLLAFPGGYGGMVQTDRGRATLSCCVRRDRLARCRSEFPGLAAGDAVLAYLRSQCAGADAALRGATLEPQSWRSAGPIRPGIRGAVSHGIFLAGNAAGEAHPVVAEGISMALQAGWLLARHLAAGDGAGYPAAWSRAFARRIRLASLVAHWAMRPAAVRAVMPLLRAWPLLVTESARQSGKVSHPCARDFEPAERRARERTA